MISFTKYLTERESEAVMRRALTLLLQLIEIHSVEGEESEHEHFRAEIKAIAAGLSEETPPERVFIMVGEVAASLKQYSERTTRYIKSQTTEYHRMLAMLTQTVAATSHASGRTVAQLQQIEKKLAGVALIEDVRVLRIQLGECLGSIREEINRQREESIALARRVPVPDGASAISSKEGAAAWPLDPVTRLPGRSAAEAALNDVSRRQGRWYAVAIVANRLAAINSRFGYEVGDGVLRILSQQLVAGLSAEDSLFRWSGPCLIALLQRSGQEKDVRNELARITNVQKESVVEIGSRSVLLPVSASSRVLPSNEPADVLREKIDQFVASQAAGS